MARTNATNSATSQFFITLHDDAKRSLDGKYAAFGYVVKGMSVVDAIAEDLIKAPSSGYMGFVGNEDAITIVSAKILEGYSPD
jgi:peptidyl-prolyl cis-trans isomerase B (cyclophilin B)